MKLILPLVLISMIFSVSSCVTEQVVTASPSIKVNGPDPAPIEIVEAAPENKETSQSGAGGSEIKTMVDGFGNRTETRRFVDDPLINIVQLTTRVTGGQSAYVYGHNGEVKFLEDVKDKDILKMMPAEIAKLTGITEGKKTAVPELPAVAEFDAGRLYTASDQNTGFAENSPPSPTPTVTVSVRKDESTSRQQPEVLQKRLNFLDPKKRLEQ